MIPTRAGRSAQQRARANVVSVSLEFSCCLGFALASFDMVWEALGVTLLGTHVRICRSERQHAAG